MDLGSPSLVPFDDTIMIDNGQIGLGIYTAAGGDVNVTAQGTINVDSSRIGTFDGGNVNIESLTGDVLASNRTTAVPINIFTPTFSVPVAEAPFANGIVAFTIQGTVPFSGAATTPGNITITTLEGNIIAQAGGIEQLALRPGAGDYSITLSAGTPKNGDWNVPDPTIDPEFVGNIDLSGAGIGAIGGNITARATGFIKGKFFATHNVSLAGLVQDTLVIAGGHVNFAGNVGPTVEAIGIGGVTGDPANSLTLPTSAGASQSSQSAAQVATTTSSQQVSLNMVAAAGAEENRKAKKAATVKISHVSVILSAATR